MKQYKIRAEIGPKKVSKFFIRMSNCSKMEKVEPAISRLQEILRGLEHGYLRREIVVVSVFNSCDELNPVHLTKNQMERFRDGISDITYFGGPLQVFLPVVDMLMHSIKNI